MKKKSIALSGIAALAVAGGIAINQPAEVKNFCCETSMGCRVEISVNECSENIGWRPYANAECDITDGLCKDINDGITLRKQ